MIKVTVYEKTDSYCVHCEQMRAVMDEWLNHNPDVEVSVVTFSIEENLELMMEYGFNSAPVYVIENQDVTTMTSGNNPDLLVDALENRNSVWDD